ncbi:MAG: Asp-tRNA(Asn)/Glu-tRNA(Gln) amidotransferase subunit GatB, partial [Planctomycetes bacterium]|nr:Asp-tRNA(Asn)/Glu-tRNA(Gln) amidotransferase subunit GatB [Planctomycetota bacterium]
LEITRDKGQFEPKRVRTTRAHLEEDAGKSIHDEGAGTAVAGRADSEIDLNRTGTPLLEIVSEPDMRSSAEAKTFLQDLKLLLTYLGVSDCNMQEGSLRVDANVNLHIDAPTGSVGKPVGKIATPIVEIKNMNSFRAVERALDYEAERQYRVWQETGQRLGEAPKQTRGWDDAAGVTRGQRSKEESSDYRYFPDPDLVPVITTPERVEEVRASLGELPAQLRTRLTTDFGLSPYDAEVLVNQGRELVDYFLEVAELSGDAKAACNWVTQEVLRVLKEKQIKISDFKVSHEMLADQIKEVLAGNVPESRSKDLFNKVNLEAHLVDKGSVSASLTVKKAIQDLGIKQVDESELVALCQELLDANPKIVADVQSGKHQAVGALIGQAKQKNPNVDPGQVRATCLKLIQQ